MLSTPKVTWVPSKKRGAPECTLQSTSRGSAESWVLTGTSPLAHVISWGGISRIVQVLFGLLVGAYFSRILRALFGRTYLPFCCSRTRLADSVRAATATQRPLFFATTGGVFCFWGRRTRMRAIGAASARLTSQKHSFSTFWG